MTAPIQTEVVTAFITRGGKILLLRRSPAVKSYVGRWAGVSGYLETTDPLDQAHVELEEELGIERESATLECAGKPIVALDESISKKWRIFPFRFSIPEDLALRLDWEHEEMRWVNPKEIPNMTTVPKLYDAWRRVEAGFISINEEA